LFNALLLLLRQSLAGQAEHSLRGSRGQSPLSPSADGETPYRSRALQGGELRQRRKRGTLCDRERPPLSRS